MDDNDLLLGLDPATRRAEQVAFVEPGATLILYTDGLVERRGRDVDEGIEALIDLVRATAPGAADVEDLCDRLLDGMVDGTPEDDVALLAVRLRQP